MAQGADRFCAKCGSPRSPNEPCSNCGDPPTAKAEIPAATPMKPIPAAPTPVPATVRKLPTGQRVLNVVFALAIMILALLVALLALKSNPTTVIPASATPGGVSSTPTVAPPTLTPVVLGSNLPLPCNPCADPRITLVLNRMIANTQADQVYVLLTFTNATSADVTLLFSTLTLTNNATGASDSGTQNSTGAYAPVPVAAYDSWPVTQLFSLGPTPGATYTFVVVMRLPDGLLNAYKVTNLTPTAA